MKIVTLLAGLLLVAAVAVAPVAAAQQRTHLLAVLDGANQNPPVSTTGHGFFRATLSSDGTQLTFRLNVGGLVNVTAAHIHLGNSTTNGPVVAFLFKASSPLARANGVLASGTLTAADLVGPLQGQPFSALVNAMESGNAYVNVHTTQHPSGEIRGQIVLMGQGS